MFDNNDQFKVKPNNISEYNNTYTSNIYNDAINYNGWSNGSLNHTMAISLDDPNLINLVKRIFLNNFDFSYLEEIFKECTEEELKLIHSNYEYIVKLVEKHYFNKV